MRKTFYCHLALALTGLFTSAAAADLPARIMGAASCASASCHGGGGPAQNQFLVWSIKDFHSQRPPATLVTARAKQIADALGIKDAAADARCASCHAPLQLVPANLLGDNARVAEGVSCESCHGPAEQWLRSHTRPDYTRADRVTSGMRDLQNLYVRANTCVACHQNVDSDLLKAGHPELIFELDGQCAAEPRHWSAGKNGNGAQAWVVGQATALREMSWKISRDSSPSENEFNRWTALLWLLQTAAPESNLKTPAQDHRAAVQAASVLQNEIDAFARGSAAAGWSDGKTRQVLNALADSSRSFRDPSVSQPQQARRAERLVLGLDRVIGALPELQSHQPVQSALNELFAEAQSIPDFNPEQFANLLDKLRAALP